MRNLLCLLVVLVACQAPVTSSPTVAPVPAPTPVVQAPPPVKEVVPEPPKVKEAPPAKTRSEIIAETPTLDAMLELARADLKDRGPTDEIPLGWYEMLLWSNRNLQWGDIQARPATKAGLVHKDSSAEIGKRMCVSGLIIEISTGDVAGGKFYEGGILDTQNSDVYKFIALRNSGTLVGSDHARFCGIVLGNHSYSNSSGGVTHAIQLLGLFDLKGNH